MIPDHLAQPLANLLLSIADDKLMLGHRNSDWTGLGPILEEDIAFSHMAQDEIAHAQLLYQFVSELPGAGAATADALAFGRQPHQYRCAHIVEAPDAFDWATALARKFFCDHFDLQRLRRLRESIHKPLADLSGRIAAEEQLHVDHVNRWVVRLGRGTAESRERLQRSLRALAPMAGGLFEPVDDVAALESSRMYPGSGAAMFTSWATSLEQVLGEAGFTQGVAPPDADARGGRRGVHSEHFTELLDEMCEVYRIAPNSAW